MAQNGTGCLQLLRRGAVLAPMAGVTDLPFRRICLEYGAAYTVTEMVSAKGYVMSGEKQLATRQLLATAPEEAGRVALQLFGHEPDVVAEAAARLSEEKPFFMIDFNMGCPVPKVCGNGDGSALLSEPQLAGKVLEALVKASRVPVSVKLRLGFEPGRETFLEVSKAAEDAGVSLIMLHARTRTQYYAGSADWEKIALLKQSINIPVIGNGDINCAADAIRMLYETGCDGVAVGRAAEGNPFIFREIYEKMAGLPVTPPTLEERKNILLRHARDLIAFKGEYIGIREMRRHAGSYVRGMPNGVSFRRKLNTITTFSEFEEAVNEFFA